MKKLLFLLFILITLNSSQSYSQFRPYINEIINQIGSNANAFFLAANRPSYGVSTYITPKGAFGIGLGLSFNEDLYEIPLDFSYGLSRSVEVSGGITGYMQTYNLVGEKVSGMGDSYLGIRYRFHESAFFDHVFQSYIKIPSASRRKELGTGKIDFYFGAAQGFAVNNFSYEISFECNFLGRRDFPSRSREIPMVLRELLDSLKQSFDYSYEPELVFTASPAYSFSYNIYTYGGYMFTRNTKLDFNTNSLLGGVGVSTGKSFSFFLGGTYGLDEFSGWYAQLGINFLLFGKN